MHKKRLYFLFTVFLLLLFAFAAVTSVGATEDEILEEEPVLVLHDDEEIASEQEDELVAPSSEITAATTAILWVTSGLDPDSNTSYSLTSNPDGLQTLRRAVISARAATKPVEIRFNIPTGDPSYNSTLGIWKIQFAGQDSVGAAALRQLNGQIWINGGSQTGGRSWGPKIFLFGANPLWIGIKMGENATHNGNRITGLAFQNFSDHVQVNSRENIVEDCWFGLDDNGTLPYLRNSSPAQGSGVSGVAFANVTTDNGNNIIRRNVFLGLNGTAATIRGRDNNFENNFVGTRWDGTVPNPGCSSASWLGGGGVTVQNRRHTISDNIIAGLRFDQFDISQPPDALKVTADDIAGAGHTISDNKIGVDSTNAVVGSCGRGIYLSNHMRGTLISYNEIRKTSLPGMSLNGLLYNQCEFKGNIITETFIEYGPQLKDSYKNFKPAKVTSISGTTVSGTSGTGSPAPNCWIELFLDTTNNPVEAHQFLARTQADAQGNWTATIPFALTGNQGIRTTTTTVSDGTIVGTLAPTTTGLSERYPIPPPAPTLKSPAGGASVEGTRIVLQWNTAARATKYQLQVRRASDDSIFKNLTLGNVTQRAIEDFPANGAQFKWRVRAGNATGWGNWSAYRTVKNPFGVFNHNFNTTGGYRGWIRKPQASWSLNAAAMLTAGQPGKWVSAQRGNVYYRNLDYSVRMRRTNSNLGEQYLVIRAGTKYAANGLWHPGYAFGYRNNGSYRVLRLNANGSITQLKGWTNSNRINKGGFNTLRVRAVNNNLRYFINGTLVWSANNSAFARGMVGVMMFRTGSDPASTRLLVDWAKLTNPVVSSSGASKVSDLQPEDFIQSNSEEDEDFLEEEGLETEE